MRKISKLVLYKTIESYKTYFNNLVPKLQSKLEQAHILQDNRDVPVPDPDPQVVVFFENGFLVLSICSVSKQTKENSLGFSSSESRGNIILNNNFGKQTEEYRFSLLLEGVKTQSKLEPSIRNLEKHLFPLRC